MNRWFFWVLAPIMLATAIGLPFLVEPPTRTGVVVTYVFCAGLVFATLGLANPRKLGWALRPVAAIILLAYGAYAYDEYREWRNGAPFGLTSSRSDTNLFNALWGLAIFGVPSIYFLFRGRSGTAVDALLDDPDAPDDGGDEGEELLDDEEDEH